MAAAESAKPAGFDADVGEIDVAVDDVGHDVTDGRFTELVCRGEHHHQIRAFGIEKRGRVVDGELGA